MRERKALHLIIACSFVGLILSTYAFLHNKAFVSGAFCTINSTFNCDIVNRGPYSELLGVPVALLGMTGYLFFAIAAGMSLRRPTDKGLLTFLVIASSGALAFSLYLTWIEAFVLFAWCLICITSQLMILTIFGSSLYIRFKKPDATKVARNIS